MNKKFFPQMAFTNVKKNRSLYVPYLLTCIISVAMFYIMESIVHDDGISSMPQGRSLLQILEFGIILIGIFTIVFLFYTNSFLMKRRKKELGLYNVLGMEKKHIAIVLCFETLYVGAISIITGIILGMILSKFMVLLLGKMLTFDVNLDFRLTYHSLVYTIALFIIIFIIILAFNLLQIIKTKPIELLHSDKAGEREPKANWLLAIAGLIFLGIGYYISITTTSPLQAITMFFFAVIFVVTGTYLFFTAGSIAILKLLKKNKKFYYKTNHYVAVSGMIYRMKQNAIGLSNICILSTMVLVILSTTVSLYVGSDAEIAQRYPYDCYIYVNTKDHTVLQEDIQSVVRQKAEEESIDCSVIEKSYYINAYLEKKKNGYRVLENDTDLSISDWICSEIYTKEEYEAIVGKTIPELKDNEICVYTSLTSEKEKRSVNLEGKEYDVVQYLEKFPGIENASLLSTEAYCIIVKDQKAMLELMKNLDGTLFYGVGTNMKMSEDNKIGASNMLFQAVKEKFTSYKLDEDSLCVEIRQAEQDEFLATYGGFLFLGIFLGLLFLMATTLTIYYKQISEGYEDQSKFHIMSKVGMTKKEIKSSIQSQVLLVFFMPLIVATIHVCAAFPLIVRMLNIFGLQDIYLFLKCSIFVFFIFTIFYGVIYKLTARIYYKIVTTEVAN